MMASYFPNHPSHQQGASQAWSHVSAQHSAQTPSFPLNASQKRGFPEEDHSGLQQCSGFPYHAGGPKEGGVNAMMYQPNAKRIRSDSPDTIHFGAGHVTQQATSGIALSAEPMSHHPHQHLAMPHHVNGLHMDVSMSTPTITIPASEDTFTTPMGVTMSYGDTPTVTHPNTSIVSRPAGCMTQTLDPLPETQVHDYHPGLLRRYLNGSYY